MAVLNTKFCVRCDKGFEPGDNMVQYEGALFHVDHFFCGGPCRKKLEVTDPLWTRQGLPWCKECYGDDMARMCWRCGLRIQMDDHGIIKGFRVGEFDFHQDCYKCNLCSKGFTTNAGGEGEDPYEMEGEAYCKECALQLRAKKVKKKPKARWGDKCKKCKKKKPKATVLGMDGKLYHPACQPCRRCKKSVQGKEYMLEQRRAYCKSCAEVAFLTKCVVCDKAVEVPQHGEKVKHIRTALGVYHENCFKCATCNTGLMVDGKSTAFPVGHALYCADHKDDAEAVLLAAEAARIEAAKPKGPPVPAVNTIPKLPPSLPAARKPANPTYGTVAEEVAGADSTYMAPTGTLISRPVSTEPTYGEIEDGEMDATYGEIDAFAPGVGANQEEAIYDYGDDVAARIIPDDTYGHAESEIVSENNIYGREETEIIPDDTYGNAESVSVSTENIYGIGIEEAEIIPDDTYGNAESKIVSENNIYGREEPEIIPDDTYGNAEPVSVSTENIYGIGIEKAEIIPDDTYGNAESSATIKPEPTYGLGPEQSEGQSKLTYGVAHDIALPDATVPTQGMSHPLIQPEETYDNHGMHAPGTALYGRGQTLAGGGIYDNGEDAKPTPALELGKSKKSAPLVPELPAEDPDAQYDQFKDAAGSSTGGDHFAPGSEAYDVLMDDASK